MGPLHNIDRRESDRLRKKLLRLAHGVRAQSSRTQTADETAFRVSLGISFGRWYRATKHGPEAVLELVTSSGGQTVCLDTFYPVENHKRQADSFYPRRDDWQTILRELKAGAQTARDEYYADDPGWRAV